MHSLPSPAFRFLSPVTFAATNDSKATSATTSCHGYASSLSTIDARNTIDEGTAACSEKVVRRRERAERLIGKGECAELRTCIVDGRIERDGQV